jgi:DNA-binding response OmpR family regulator
MTRHEPRILVVEDDPNDAILLQRAFRKLGIPGFDLVLPDGQEALDYLDGQGGYRDRTVFPLPSHLILDLKLPRVSGLELLSWIRSSADHGQLRVVILSSSGELTDQVRARELGVDAYYVKPNRSVDLLGVVQEIGRMWSLNGVRV